ncbi:hypothetical protein B0H11DRAFT_2229752 [Mycena galericulata]|nr:hypothetical protein B0H11DRAFT_2229752 [Mycena galericulata]
MAPQFTSAPTKHVVRPFLPAPCPVTLPVLLTNIIPEQFPLPRMLVDMDPRRTPSPPLGPHRAPTPRAPTPAPQQRHFMPDSRESSLTPVESEDSDAESSVSTKKPNGSTQITRPSGANIQTVKALFKDCYPHLTQLEQEKEYTDFRAHLDLLCTQHLCPSVVLTYQDKDARDKVYNKMTAKFPWLAHYHQYWPVSVCLQGKLHNSAARAIEKSTRKAASILAGVAPARASSKKAKQRGAKQ